jgi:hypothetical protein
MDNIDKGFWVNKPLEISNTRKYDTIITREQMLAKISKYLENNNFQLDYNVIESEQLSSDKISSIVTFVNKNYVTSKDNVMMLSYTDNLFSYYCNNALIIEFYPKNKNTIIGYIVGKKSTLSIHDKTLDSSEVNFLCIIPSLRNLGVSSYMINVLTKEIITRWNIITSHYTIEKNINSPYFGEKMYYHRLINISNLFNTGFLENVDKNILIKAYNNFAFPADFTNTHTLKYIYNQNIEESLLVSLYDSYIDYCKNTYDIYETITLNEFKKTFTNKSFHHFIVYNKNEIVAYVCIFGLDSLNKIVNLLQKTGYYYHMFFNQKNNLLHYLELIHEYIYNNDLFDVLTLSDIFDINYNKYKYIRGSGVLRYYLYNFKISVINNNKNGLITI